MKKILLIAIILLGSIVGTTNAEEVLSVNLTIRDGANIIFENTVPLQPVGMIELNGHQLDANSVLSVLNDADVLSDAFSITDLQYYDSMSSFYLKCINDKCDNWQYVVNNVYGNAIDKTILSGGENIYLYFGSHYKITLDSSLITTNQNLKATAQDYDYQNDTWIAGNGLTIGIIEPNSWPTVEVQTKVADANGEVIFSSIPVGSHSVGIQPDYFPTEALTVTEFIEPPSSGGGGGSSRKTEAVEIKPTFNINKAYEFLISNQKEDGSFGSELYTDWATIALMSTDKYQDAKIKLIKYYTSNKTKGEMLTDYERYAMAIMSLGLNPYNINGENYIEKIIKEFDGTQFGNENEVNDDIFALIVLQNAGFNNDDTMIQKTIEFILSKQKDDGSWNNSVDMTGATIQALSSFSEGNFLLRGVSQADEPRGSAGLASPDSDLGKEEFSTAKAKEFLRQKQNTDGSWENISSTSWALQGLLSLNEKIEDSTLDYLAKNQDKDGGIKDADLNNRIWQTSYVLSAVTEKTWLKTMQKFEKKTIEIVKEKEVIKIAKTPIIKKETKKIVIEKEAEKTENIIPNQTATALNALDNMNENKEIKTESKFKKTLMTIFNFIF